MCIQSSKTSSPTSTQFRPPLAFKRTNRFSRVQRKEKTSSPIESVVEKVDNKQKEQKNDVFGLKKRVGIYRKQLPLPPLPRRIAAPKPAPFAPIDLPKRPKRIVAPKPAQVVPQRKPRPTIQTNVNFPPQKNVIVSPDGLRPMQRNMGCPPMNRNTPPVFMQPPFYPQPPPQNFYPQPPYPQNFYQQPQYPPQFYNPQPENYYGPGYQPQNQTFSQMRPANHQQRPPFYPQTQPQSQFYPQTQPYPQFYPQQPQPFRPFSNEPPYQPQNNGDGKISKEDLKRNFDLKELDCGKLSGNKENLKLEKNKELYEKLKHCTEIYAQTETGWQKIKIVQLHSTQPKFYGETALVKKFWDVDAEKMQIEKPGSYVEPRTQAHGRKKLPYC